MATKLALTPAFTGALLFALTASPDRFREPLIAQLRQYISATNLSRAVTTLKWLFAAGLGSTVNEWLSELAQNNFRLRSEAHRYDWPNEIAVITGATGGFGSLMSKDLANRGVRVMALDVRDELPADMKHPKIHYFKCDVTDRDAVAEVAKQIRQQHGDPSILINNAGISGEGPIVDQTKESLRKIFDINVISHYYTVQEFLPAMAANKKGHVVTVASMASFATTAGIVPYSNTKVAALSFHEGLQLEARVFHDAPEIKFSSLHPSFASTPMVAPHLKELEKAGAAVLKPIDVSNAVIKQIVSGRGKQIILAGNLGPAVYLRSFPHWLSQAVFQLGDLQTKKALQNKFPKKQ
ncbi:related to a retinal short-chain dehydrogenase/reductase [Ramularia collo-cygni]|uniref:Short-chain dehydrogenase/reductase 3 n=1 Tax=Ramularia collo-cygni TaxID=112498 RepID=A0A2D3VEC6_9PEZI|nr:related to a retinal short-chain dehydrogenase/reductase [Ramularia collo-cygni]CZT25480.1 related to a retinal short-chain dehydrogenase/reductase [Ramularia collo-cygni]